MAHDPGTDLDQLLAKRRERPLLDLLGQRQGAQEPRAWSWSGTWIVQELENDIDLTGARRHIHHYF